MLNFDAASSLVQYLDLQGPLMTQKEDVSTYYEA